VEAERPIRDALWAAIRQQLTGVKLKRAALSKLVTWQSARAVIELRRLNVKGGHEACVLDLIARAADTDLDGWIVDLCGAAEVEPQGHMHDDRKRDRADLWALGKLAGVDCDAIAKKLTPTQAKAAAKDSAAIPAKEKPSKSTPAKPTKKRTLDAASRKRIAEAMRKRWAAARQKKAGRK
jgi:hypothetical protein